MNWLKAKHSNQNGLVDFVEGKALNGFFLKKGTQYSDFANA